MRSAVQVGVIGAMQRAHPALTQLWLQWTGIPDLDKATFELARPEGGSNPATGVHLSAKHNVQVTWAKLCDALSLPESAPQRRRMPIHLDAQDEAHAAFWGAMRRRELEEVDGPIEWWWRLMVMRFRSIYRASQTLIREAIGDQPLLDKGLISFRNPTLKESGHRVEKILAGVYRQPTHLVVSLRVKRNARHEGLAFGLDDDNFKGRFVSKLVELAVSRV